MAPNCTLPVPAGVIVILCTPLACTALLTSILALLLAFSFKTMAPVALMPVPPLAISTPAVASAPAKPDKLEPVSVRLPPLAIEPALVT